MTQKEIQKAILLQQEIDKADILATAYSRFSKTHWEGLHNAGVRNGMRQAMKIIFPELNGERAFPLNTNEHIALIEQKYNEIVDEDHDRWVKKVQGE